MRPSSVRRSGVRPVVAALLLAVVAVACQGGGNEGAEGPDDTATVPGDADASADRELDEDAEPAPDPTPDPDADPPAGAAPDPDEGAAPEPDGGSQAPAREALAFTARSLDGGEVDVAAISDGPVLLWMWAPW